VVASPSTAPDSHEPEKLGSLYCADPNCEYCKELHKAEEELRNHTAAEKSA
jgi:hypothetical protein